MVDTGIDAVALGDPTDSRARQLRRREAIRPAAARHRQRPGSDPGARPLARHRRRPRKVPRVRPQHVTRFTLSLFVTLVMFSTHLPAEAMLPAVAYGVAEAASTSVGAGTQPVPTVAGRTLTLTWPAANLASGQPSPGYAVRRYDPGTSAELPIATGTCAAVVSAITCTHTGVPPGTWRYTVTQAAGAWRGTESPPATATVLAPALSLSAAPVRPTVAVTGTLSGFVDGENLTYRLDSPTGPVMAGTLAGTTTPTPVPAGGAAAVTVTVPAGTSDGAHTVFAVTTPNNESASAPTTVDGTPPPVPNLTQVPGAVSGPAVRFEFSDTEPAATFECSLDGALYTVCVSPLDYTGLAAGAHSFAVRAVDAAGNRSSPATHSWTVDVTAPTVTMLFPDAAGRYSTITFDAGCSTVPGDVCGTAVDASPGVSAVAVSLRDGGGNYWNGTTFAGATETWLPATGTGSWSYAVAGASMPEGDYQLRARATDGVGNAGFGLRTFTIDRTAPPAPTFTTSPPATSGPNVPVAYSSTDAGASFECQLDVGAWAACPTPRTLTGLATGSHTLAVRAVDAAGNTGPATSVTWTVDATTPTVTTTFPTATSYSAAAWTAGCATPAAGDVCGTAADAGSGVAAVAVSVLQTSSGLYWDGGTFTAAAQTWLPATGTTTWSYALASASMTDGSYTLASRATDGVGNVGAQVAVTYTIDTTGPPAPVLTGMPTNPSGTGATFTWTLASGTAECRRDGAAYANCTSPVTYAGLAGGAHTFDVRAYDAVGNRGAVTSHAWNVDVNAPSVAITFPAAGGTYNNAGFDAGCSGTGDLCGTASDNQSVASVQVTVRRSSDGFYWNGTQFLNNTLVWLTATGTTSWSYPFSGASFPAEGAYVIDARATDSVGLTSTSTATVTIDRTAPALPTLGGGPANGSVTNGTSTPFTFTSAGATTFQCRIDGGAATTCTSPTADPTAPGGHSFQVQAVDAAGNISAFTGLRTWTVDTTPPVPTITFPAAGGFYSSATWDTGCGTGGGDVCGTVTDAGGSTVANVTGTLYKAGTNRWLNGAGTAFDSLTAVWLPLTGTAGWTGNLPNGTFPVGVPDTYTMQVRAMDAVGNVSTPITRSFTIDRTAPTATMVAAPGRGTLGRIEIGDTLVLTYSEPVAPGSLIAGWTGAAPENIVVRQANDPDTLTFWNSGDATQLPWGTVALGNNGYASAALKWGLAAAAVRSTVSVSGAVVTITFGTPNVPGSVGTVAATANMTWTPVAGVTDLAGNSIGTVARLETDADRDF